MNILRNVLGPVSKYDKTLPYTYMAKVREIEDVDDVFSYYFADTICGLIEYLSENKIDPTEVFLYGMYLKEEYELDIRYCTTEDGQWLKRPDICKSLEEHYKQSLEFCYKGHKQVGTCSFDDREREGSGPY